MQKKTQKSPATKKIQAYGKWLHKYFKSFKIETGRPKFPRFRCRFMHNGWKM